MRRRVIMGLPFLVLIGIAGFFQNCTSGGGMVGTGNQPEEVIPTEPPTISRTDFMTGLNSPWDLAFTPDGAMLFTEKCRGLSVRRADGTVVRLFGTAGSAVVASDFFCEGQSGMRGVAIDPSFASNRTLFVYMSSNLTANPRTNRVVRLTVDSGYTTVANRTDIITNIAFKHAANSWGGAGSHSGGRIRFGPDGFLYVTTGDNHNGTVPQDLNSLGGKVLRVDRNGTAAPGNNAPSGGDSRIYTYGHRNVQGITFRHVNGQPYSCEHGPNHSDEITPLVAGGNAGWDPKPEAGVTCNDNYCGYVSNKTSGELTPMTDTAKFPSALRPLISNSDSQGMGPCTFLGGSQWKSWNRRLVVGIMGDQRLDMIKLDAAGNVAETTTVSLPTARIRSLVQGPDGSLYVATDAGAIWKITPQ